MTTRTAWPIFLLSLTFCPWPWPDLGKTSPQSLVVQTRQGPVRGVLSDDGLYYSFLGIPYGTVNATNRFKRALPPPTWTKVREPVKVICPQDNIDVSEDCLVINIFKPYDLAEGVLLPIKVEIHGGYFQIGEPYVGIKYVVTKKILSVSISYRLGLFGFNCLETENISANIGMKDQVDALRWVRENISSFGGDPNAVTIAGVSSGAACVDYLLLSPMAKGLFHAAILQSGVSTSTWTFNPRPIELLQIAGEMLNSTSNDLMEIEKVFLKASTHAITEVTRIFFEKWGGQYKVFTPCVENKKDTEENFLTKAPQDVLMAGEQNTVPTLIGFNEKEGIFLMPATADNKTLGTLGENVCDILPRAIQLLNDVDKTSICEQVKNFYFGDNPINTNNVYDLIDLRSDVMFLWPLFWRLRLDTKIHKNTYLYEFMYDGNLNFLKIRDNLTIYKGACHADERGYIHSYPDMVGTPTKEDEKIVKIMTTMWANFIKFRKPTVGVSELLPVAWEPYSKAKQNFLKINSTLELKDFAKDPVQKRLMMWKSIYERYLNKMPTA